MKQTVGVQIRRTSGEVLIPQCRVATTSFARLKGLIGETRMTLDRSLVFFGGCQQMHSFFMKVPIDVIFLDRDQRVLGLCELKPWRVTPFFLKARTVVEVPYGFCGQQNIQIGEQLEILP